VPLDYWPLAGGNGGRWSQIRPLVIPLITANAATQIEGWGHLVERR
jgi:hypothetical protein